MERKIYLYSTLRKQLETNDLKEDKIGFLISVPVTQENEFHIVSAISCTSTEEKVIFAEIQNAMLTLPGGFVLSGVFFNVKDATSSTSVQQFMEKTLPNDIDPWFCENKYVYAIDTDNEDQSCLYVYDFKLNGLQRVDFETCSSEDFTNFIPFRLKATVPLRFEYSTLKDDVRFDIQAEFIHLENMLKSEQTTYRIKNTKTLIPSCFDDTSFSKNYSCSDLFTIIDKNNEGKKKRKKGDYSKEIIHLELFSKVSGESAIRKSVACAPLIHHEHKYFKDVAFKLPVDVVIYMHHKEVLKYLHERVTNAVLRQLFCMANYLLRNVKDMESLHTPEPFHFHPPQLSHLITVVYPNDLPEEALTNTRKLLHKKLMLPNDRPYLRRLSQFVWPDETIPGGYLLNVHEGVKPSGVQGGKVSLVSGKYCYHHYMQDKINDDGWGCAYRSLQTLISWFRFQGYTSQNIPTHKQIQEILVKIGDKPDKIIGSKTWIGSVEVGMVLESWIGVQSKILFVNNGAEMAMKGRELAMHFETQGTPVMIGGGVLAHTILGVHFDEVTGDIKFLILDPHYTGSEDIKTIQEKGWCGWKGPLFWDQNSHYNMCMPQRPVLI